MMGSRACAWLVLALGCGSTALGLNPDHKLTQYLHRTWQTQAGLAQASIHVITQSHDGYLWVGTQSGVARFDGVEFQPVRALEANFLGELWARGMVEDTVGRLWITTNDFHLVRVSGSDVKVFTEKDGLSARDFSCLVPGSSGDMWACTTAGLAHIVGDNVEVHESPTQIVNRPTGGCRASDGKIWIAGGQVLAAWDGSEFTRVVLKSISGSREMRSLLCRDDGVWVGTDKGLVRYNAGVEKLYTEKDGLADDVILSLAQGQNGSVWVGTRNGFSRVRNGAIDSYGYRDGLSQNTVFGVYEDREGSLWVATKNGLNQFLDGAAARYDRSEGLPKDNMGPVFQDRRGTLWAGSLDGVLSRFNGRFFTALANFPRVRINVLADDSAGDLWAGTSQGAIHLQDGQVKESFTTAQGLPANQIRSLFRDHAGNLWAGTQKGPAVFQGGHFIQVRFLAKELPFPIVAIGETRDGGMLFSAERGNVYVFAEGGVRKFESPAGAVPLFQDINAFYTDRDGIVWMGANGAGLGMLRNGKFTRFLVRDGLYDGEIYGFVMDAQDRLWMACGKGFFWVDRKELLKFADRSISKITSTPYSPLDGLRTIQGTPGVQPVGVRTTDGRLWFSTTGWLLAFASDQGIRPGEVPPVVIENMTIDGSEVDPGSVKTLGPGRANVAFQYTALTYVAPGRMKFRYLLEGYDRDWTNAGSRREAFYTNLPPGKFRFRVVACGAFVSCNETGTALDFEVAPQFYQRSWFIPLCLAVAALLAWLSYRFRVQQLREQFVLVLAERSRIARELHDTLIQGFSGITMQLHAFTNRLTAKADQQALGEIIRDAGICLQETRRSVAGLRAGTGPSSGLAVAISDAALQLTQERDIRLKLNLDDRQQELPAEVKYNLLCIVQEAITNSIKHSGAHNIEVALACSANDLRLSVRDDGRGMERGESNGRAGHYGMVGLRERASQIGAELDLASAPGQGTKVSLRMPLAPRSPLPSHEGRLEAV
ncbi:MAG: histidine kinase [Acidobacteriota bacterium]|nr:histidine kinase [Acidobacteriota bacterium]